jgi:prepilin-type N-terminal cleavage/methylation domain-containing protein
MTRGLQPRRRLAMKRFNRQHGVSMLEIMVAMGILGVAGIALLLSMSTAFRSQDISREQVRGENLVRSQLEYIREQAYFTPPSLPYLIPPGNDPGAYTVPPPVATVPSDYTITVTITQYCDSEGTCYDINQIQQNTVRVFRNEEELIAVEDLKANR